MIRDQGSGIRDQAQGVEISIDLRAHAQEAIEVYRASLDKPAMAVILNEKELHRAIVQAMDNVLVELIHHMEQHVKEGFDAVDPRQIQH